MGPTAEINLSKTAPIRDRQQKPRNGLAKLAEALKDYPPGQKLIVWGIVVLIIAGLFGGVAPLAK
jgi:hypothetical protein